MKTILLLITITTFYYAPAQQVSDRKMKSHLKEVAKSKEKGTIIWDLDTVFNAGVPYCIIIEKSNGALRPSDFSVRSLQGRELIYVKFQSYSKPSFAPGNNQYAPANTNVCYYTYYFTDTQDKAETRAPSKVYKTVAENNLIDGDHINSVEEAKFVSLNGMKFSEAENNAGSSGGPTGSQPGNNGGYNNLVERNRNKMISIINNQVIQDNTTVGSVQMSQDAENGTIIKTLSVYLPDGTKIAEGKCNGINSHNWTVITMKDNQRRMVNSSFNNDAIDVVKMLINAYYL